MTAVTVLAVSSAWPRSTVMKAVSAASRPVAMRSRARRGARAVASKANHRPAMHTSATAWKSMGNSPGA